MRWDHIELLVPDRAAALAWYREWFDFVPIPQPDEWAKNGPIMVSPDGGDTKLALFTGEPQAAAEERGWRRVAFRVTAGEFAAFARRYRASGQTLQGPVDHQTAWSVYLSDPWGNALEVTTYDYAAGALTVSELS